MSKQNEEYMYCKNPKNKNKRHITTTAIVIKYNKRSYQDILISVDKYKRKHLSNKLATTFAKSFLPWKFHEISKTNNKQQQ